jgi:crossover junction endodeoxyribonuclease RuvC
MRVFGIDCGTEITGFGVVETRETERELKMICSAMGGIRLPRSESLPERLEHVFRELTAQLEQWRPDVVAVEEVFYSVNAKSALKLGQVRGVALLAAARQGLPVAEYAPLRIKKNRSSSWWRACWAWPSLPSRPTPPMRLRSPSATSTPRKH